MIGASVFVFGLGGHARLLFIPTADSPLVAKQVERVVSVDLDSFWPKETNEETNDEPIKPDRPVVDDLLAINDGDGPPIATPNGPAWRALSDAVERGALPAELLFPAWVEGSARGSDQTVPALERRRSLKRATWSTSVTQAASPTWSRTVACSAILVLSRWPWRRSETASIPKKTDGWCSSKPLGTYSQLG